MRRTLLVALLASIASQATAAALDVEGDWLAGSRDGSIRGYVRISDCGDGTPCGILTDYDTSKTAQRRDARNPDPRLRPRSLVGVPVLWGFTRQGKSGAKDIFTTPRMAARSTVISSLTVEATFA